MKNIVSANDLFEINTTKGRETGKLFQNFSFIKDTDNKKATPNGWLPILSSEKCKITSLILPKKPF